MVKGFKLGDLSLQDFVEAGYSAEDYREHLEALSWFGKGDYEKDPYAMARTERTTKELSGTVSGSFDMMELAGRGAERAGNLGVRDPFLELAATIADPQQK